MGKSCRRREFMKINYYKRNIEKSKCQYTLKTMSFNSKETVNSKVSADLKVLLV